jgi:hypothetical protein
MRFTTSTVVSTGESQILCQEEPEARSSTSSSESLHPTAALLTLKPILKVWLPKTKADSPMTWTKQRNWKEGEREVREIGHWVRSTSYRSLIFFSLYLLFAFEWQMRAGRWILSVDDRGSLCASPHSIAGPALAHSFHGHLSFTLPTPIANRRDIR